MDAIQLVDPSQDPKAALRTSEFQRPEPGPGEVLVQINASAVCRTDLQQATGDLPPHKLPVVPGHQVVGVVRAVGSQTNSELIGQRVGLVWLANVCGTCRFCSSGRENLCDVAQFTGYDVDGGYAEWTLARADFVHSIPDMGANFPAGLAGDIAIAPLLCGGVIGYRALHVAEIGPDSAGARLGLYGFGASASLTIQMATYFGVRSFVVTRSPTEVARAKALGAEWAGTYDEQVPEKLDAAITFAPAGRVVTDALQALDKGGTVAINAIHLDNIPAIDYDDLWWERSIRSVANVTRKDVRDFLNVVGPAGIHTATETLPLSQAATALERLRAGDVAGAFVLIPPGQTD
jgi:propanol-preferring alcohol dehydrogenase